MGRARPIILETISFSKAGDASTFFREILWKYSLDEQISDDDAVHLKSLLQRHDDAESKIGDGVDYFSVRPAPEYSADRCFWITRTDGSSVDFSYKHCLEKKPYD